MLKNNNSKNELNQVEKLRKKSIDELKAIDTFGRIKNRAKLTKEDLIITLLKSASSTLENDFMKHFNNNNNNTDDDTYDGKIGKISDTNDT